MNLIALNYLFEMIKKFVCPTRPSNIFNFYSRCFLIDIIKLYLSMLSSKLLLSYSMSYWNWNNIMVRPKNNFFILRSHMKIHIYSGSPWSPDHKYTVKFLLSYSIRVSNQKQFFTEVATQNRPMEMTMLWMSMRPRMAMLLLSMRPRMKRKV